MNILITGGTGFVGQALCAALALRGHQLTVLSRQGQDALALLPEGSSVVTSLGDIAKDQHFDAVINLAGEGIADRRWTESRKQALQDSRIGLTAELAALVARLDNKPGLLINGSAVGFYGDAGDAELDENSPAVRKDFTYLLCDAWAKAARQIGRQGVRACLLRIGVVLDADGGMLKRLVPMYRVGLGAQLGDGSQWMSWIHRHDLVRLILRLLDTPGVEGVYNAVAPQPVTHRRFHQALASACRRPALLRVPAVTLRLLLGEMSTLLLGGQRALPRRLMQEGFEFRYPDIRQALEACVQRQQDTPES